MKLYAPNTYWEATEDERNEVCNGCGAKGGMKFPSTFYGLSIKDSCNIHDWMWHEGTTLADKLFSDAIFLMNMVIQVINGSNWATQPLRIMRATKYFLAVVQVSKAYWKDKEENKYMYITFNGTFKEHTDV